MDVRARLEAARPRLATAARRRFGIDTRSLAAFRVALGLLLVADLTLRSRDLVAFHADDGVLPRAALVSEFARPEHASVYLVSGEPVVVGLLFVVAGAFALAMVAGYRTTVATVVSWVLLVSLQNRNPVVLNGGDVLFRLLLFWAMFLPLGERWSVDALRRDRDGRSRVAGVASAALLIQVVTMYVANAGFKLSGDLWMTGDAIRYVFSLGQFTVLLGDVVADYPAVLQVLDHLWLAMLVGSPLLVLLTGWRRAALVGLFAGMHLGMSATMMLGLFPFVAVAGLLAFLPAAVWRGARPHLAASGLVARGDALLSWLDGALPRVEVRDVPGWLSRAGEVTRTVVPAVFLVLVLSWNLQAAGIDAVPDRAEPAVHATRTDQYWNMFAPEPLSVDGWYVVPAELENGSRVDALHRKPVSFDRPPDLSDTYPNARWRKYLVNLWRPWNEDHRPYLAEHLCRRWNRAHETDIERLTIYYMEQPTVLGSDLEPVERVRLWQGECPYEYYG